MTAPWRRVYEGEDSVRYDRIVSQGFIETWVLPLSLEAYIKTAAREEYEDELYILEHGKERKKVQ